MRARRIPAKGLWYLHRRSQGWTWQRIATEAGIRKHSAWIAARTARQYLDQAQAFLPEPITNIERFLAREQARSLFRICEYQRTLQSRTLTPLLCEAVCALQQHGSIKAAAKALAVPWQTLRMRLRRARQLLGCFTIDQLRSLTIGDDDALYGREMAFAQADRELD